MGRLSGGPSGSRRCLVPAWGLLDPVGFAKPAAPLRSCPMYIVLSKVPRKTNRGKTNKLRAKMKRKQVKRLKRMIT